MSLLDLAQVTGFEWDGGNARKNEKHGISQGEAEELFFSMPLVVAEDTQHSHHEARYHALGRTGAGRLLHVTFTLRKAGALIRVISARTMSRREKVIYEQEAPQSDTSLSE